MIVALLGCPADPATDPPTDVADTDPPTMVVQTCQRAELEYGAGCTASWNHVTDLFGPGVTPGEPILYGVSSTRFEACESNLTLAEACGPLFGSSGCPRVDDPWFDAASDFGDWSPAEPDPRGRDLLVRRGGWAMLVTAPPPFTPVPAPVRLYFEPGGEMVLMVLASLNSPLFCCNGEGLVDYLLIGDVTGTGSCLPDGED